MSKKVRKLGDGYSLAIKTGPYTHLTLVYFYNLKRGYEQSRVKEITNEYYAKNNIDYIDLNINGEPYGNRCIRVTGKIVDIVNDLSNLFSSYDIDTCQIPHIDLRGTSVSDIPGRVYLPDNFMF